MTRSIRSWLGLSLVCGVASAALLAQTPPVTFRSGADVVLVPVWVRIDNAPVAGLTAADFALTDNGVAQEISLVTTESQPVDVTIVLDTSGSVGSASLDVLKTGIQQIAQSLAPRDRMRLVTFATSIVDAFGFQPGGTLVPVDGLDASGPTTLFDALAAALMSVPVSDRPQLVFVMSDGLDTLSFLGAPDVVSLAAASGAALYVTIVRPPPTGPPPPGVRGVARGISREVVWVTEQLRTAAARTGGLLFENPAGTALPALFGQVVADFRTGYLLSFTPRGVKQPGWHAIDVRTKDRRHTVRARAGYQG